MRIGSKVKTDSMELTSCIINENGVGLLDSGTVRFVLRFAHIKIDVSTYKY